jgi:hypothetical protein
MRRRAREWCRRVQAARRCVDPSAKLTAALKCCQESEQQQRRAGAPMAVEQHANGTARPHLSRMLISRMEVSGKPSRSFSSFTFFRAQISPVSRSRALRQQRRTPSSGRRVSRVGNKRQRQSRGVSSAGCAGEGPAGPRLCNSRRVVLSTAPSPARGQQVTHVAGPKRAQRAQHAAAASGRSVDGLRSAGPPVPTPTCTPRHRSLQRCGSASHSTPRSGTPPACLPRACCTGRRWGEGLF